MLMREVVLIFVIFFTIANCSNLVDLERCDIGDRIVQQNLKKFAYNYPKHNELLRLKWYVQEHPPYFNISNKDNFVAIRKLF